MSDGSTDPIRVLVVDDHRLFREGLAAVLETTPDIRVVGEAGNGTEALAQLDALTPDVVLMDIMMEDMNGIECARRIRSEYPDVRVVMLTMLEDDASLFAAMRAGARGYVLKGADGADVSRTVRAVAAGDALFGPAIALRLTQFFERAGLHTGAAPFPELTAREREILDCIAAGLDNRQVAARLSISGKTVSNHISNIFAKLQVADRAQAIVAAREAGLGRHEA